MEHLGFHRCNPIFVRGQSDTCGRAHECVCEHVTYAHVVARRRFAGAFEPVTWVDA